MKHEVFLTVLLVPCALACSPSEVPISQLMQVDEVADSALSEGAAADSSAAFHLDLARNEARSAERLMQNGDNTLAGLYLDRALADAELARKLAQVANVRMRATLTLQSVQELKDSLTTALHDAYAAGERAEPSSAPAKERASASEAALHGIADAD